MIEFDFDDALVFPTLPAAAPKPHLSTTPVPDSVREMRLIFDHDEQN
jgi:hypothetical protein